MQQQQLLYPDANAQEVASATAAAATLKALEYQVAFALATLDKELTKEYYNALEIVPELVTEETKFADFLRTDEYVPLLAAQRIARFWKVRKELFGDRWLLKLSGTGTGCLSMEDVQVLRTGYFSVCKSAQLGMVWLMDYSRLPTGAQYFQPNIIYYMGTVTSCQDAQIKGVTALALVTRRPQPPPMAHHDKVEYLLSALPLKFKGMVVAHAVDPDRKPVIEFQGFTLRRMVETNIRKTPVKEIVPASQADLMHQLRLRGFDATCIHSELGGQNDFNSFNEFLRMRISVEDFLMGSSPSRCGGSFANKNGPLSLSSFSKHGNNPLAMVSATTNNRATLQRLLGESSQEFERRRNAQYVKRYYHKNKLALLKLQGERDRLVQRQNALQRENAKLHELLDKARHLIVEKYFVSDKTDDTGNTPSFSV